MLDINFSQLLLNVVAVLIALTIHEYAHGYAAYKLGDNTAHTLGRLTLNPIKHLDPFGALCMLLFRFGWAKPVPINPANFKKPKRDFAITALAGPLVNITVAFISAFFLLLSEKLFVKTESVMLNNMQFNTTLFLYLFHAVNLGLGIFNLIPIPPFDGSRILNVILPQKLYFKIMRYEQKIYWGVIAWLFLGSYVYTALLSVPFIATSQLLSSIAKIFSLSHLLSSLASWLSGIMMSFWSLLPFLR